MSTEPKKDKGFTIIEVVLVLAIAGLIFLMVFIALPALQRNQRDTQRRNDMNRAQAALQQYQTNNRNSLPTATTAGWNSFRDKYLVVSGDTFEDPSFGPYSFAYQGTNREQPSTPVSDNGQIWVYASSTCDGETIVSAGARRVAMAIKLEGGGIACVNN